MEFKDRLKKHRVEKGLTQDLLARKIFVSRSAVAKWEAGLGIPSEESIAALCEVLGVTRESLFPNKEAEPLLIEKNVKIKRRMIVAAVLAVTLAISIGLLAFFGIRNYAIQKEIYSQVPNVTNISFEEKTFEDNGVDYYDGRYIVYKNHYSFALVGVTVDARLEISSLQVEFENADAFTCTVLASDTDGKIKNLWYKVPFRVRDDSITELKIASATYSFYDRSDSNEYKTKSCNVTAKPIPIQVSSTRTASVTLKFNANTVITFDVEKGESVSSAILSVGKQGYLLDHLMNTQFSYLQNKVTFTGWERADGLSLYEPIYSDIVLNACTELQPGATFNVKAKDLECPVFKSASPVFYLDGEAYDNVIYTLQEQSDSIEITENCAIKAVKPGVAIVTAKYDLGFYSGNVQFTVTVTDKIFIDVFGYRKYLTPGGGAYYAGVHGGYDYETGGVALPDEVREELEAYFNKQNQDYLIATGKERRLVELKWIGNARIVPVFDVWDEFDTDELDLFFQIGHERVNASDVKPITVTVDEVTQLAYGYTVLENGEIEFESHYIYNGSYVETNGITAEMEEVTVCINACLIKDGVYYYLPTFQIPVSLTE